MNVVQTFQDPQPIQDVASPSVTDLTKDGSSAISPPGHVASTVGTVGPNGPSSTPTSSPPPSVASPNPSQSDPSIQQVDFPQPPSRSSSSPPALPASPPQAAESGPTSPPVTITKTQQSLPSSIDEEVPVVDLSSQLPPTASIAVSSSSEAKLSALNASSSRFTLSIPFLGRAKTPLGSILGTEEKDHKTEGLRSTPSPEVKDTGEFCLTSLFKTILIILFSIRFVTTPTHYGRAICRRRSRFVAKCHGSFIRGAFHNCGRNGDVQGQYL